jgi:tartrate dehydratase beta subunit/fumarate hydratase class I family protein
MASIKTVHLKLPASTEDLAALEIGTVVYLTGRIFTAREGIYKRATEDGAGMPASKAELGAVNFHCSPAAQIWRAGPAAGRVRRTGLERVGDRRVNHRLAGLAEIRLLLLEAGDDARDVRDFRAAQTEHVRRAGGALLGGSDREA